MTRAFRFSGRTVRAIDMHVHINTGEAQKVALAQQIDARKTFHSTLAGNSIEDTAEYFGTRDMLAVIFCTDKETATGVAVSNDEVAEAVARFPDVFLGFASVDPWKGKKAIMEAQRCASDLGLLGFKFQPLSQKFRPNDEKFYPLWSALEEIGRPALFHTGTTGIGNGAPGGRGIKLEYGRPIPYIDDIAADFPDLPIICAHPGWPWHDEAIAVVRHKGNVYMDWSGWAPKYIPESTIKHGGSLLQDKVLFGSDYPLLDPDRWLEEFEELPLKPEVRQKILLLNAAKLLGLELEERFDAE